ncbi:MAG TPA: hypothetical protein VKY74_07400 [Chloroflexia bacterium]|nr:hypothetical protein [Chloroflexia bacterium]
MEQAMAVPQADGRAVDVAWTVDLAAAARAATWARDNPALLAQEVAEMAAYFPRWVLTVGPGPAITRCKACGEVLVFRAGKQRCICCGRTGAGSGLAWMGHLPMPLGGLPRVLRRVQAHPHPAYPLVTVGQTPIWLVPVAAFYPAAWPHEVPTCRYDPALFGILGIGAPGARHHIISSTAMCLYGAGDWRAVTLRVVLQQRVVNHLASLLKIGEGQDPSTAFAGRQHTYNYDYEDHGR